MDNNHGYALITGASSGIGLHMAEALAKEGYPIVAV
ncbi:MAG: short chain dehydrogenase, partial [Firmicutes bacterium]|nr:short chain dehydrogenase [Bacillota bacterium]